MIISRLNGWELLLQCDCLRLLLFPTSLHPKSLTYAGLCPQRPMGLWPRPMLMKVPSLPCVSGGMGLC